MKPTQSHYNTAQRIYDRLGRGSVADIDAIAQALAEAERGGMKRAAEMADAYAKELRKVFANDCARAVQGVRDDILSTIPDEAEASLCSDCPRVGYPTDETRCDPCPRRRSIPGEAE